MFYNTSPEKKKEKQYISSRLTEKYVICEK